VHFIRRATGLIHTKRLGGGRDLWYLLRDIPRVYLLCDMTHPYAIYPQGDVTRDMHLLCDVTHVYLVCDRTLSHEETQRGT